MKRQIILVTLPLLLAQLLSTVQAQGALKSAAPKGGCIELTTVAQQDKSVTAADGTVTKKYVPATRIVPDAEVVWTTSARNLCKKPAENVVIDQPVPEHMIFVADSTSGTDAQVTLATNGGEFMPAKDLTVSVDGVVRHAGAADVRHVRWTLNKAVAPQTTVTVRYRATVQ